MCCANYQPISLMCIACKLMEHVICSAIMNHADQYNILYPLQHGFRARISCETQLIDMINNTVSNMQQGLQTDLCVLDFSKAFDKVGHKWLVEKLKWYVVDGEVNSWIREFLSGRSECCSWWRVIQKCTCYIRSATRIRPKTMPLSVLYQWYRPWFEVNGASFCRWHNDLLGSKM